MAQVSPLSARTDATADRTSAPEALASTTAHCATGEGGVAPFSASAGRPASITTPTRLDPALAGVAPQMSAKVGVARGKRGVLSSPTAKRQPSTAPSLGVVSAGPLVANAQVLPVSW